MRFTSSLYRFATLLILAFPIWGGLGMVSARELPRNLLLSDIVDGYETTSPGFSGAQRGLPAGYWMSGIPVQTNITETVVLSKESENSLSASFSRKTSGQVFGQGAKQNLKGAPRIQNIKHGSCFCPGIYVFDKAQQVKLSGRPQNKPFFAFRSANKIYLRLSVFRL